MSFESVLQKAVFDALDGYVQLTAPVYDNVPQDSGFPYIVVGEDNINNWDTDSELGVTASVVIHTWSRYRGKKETKELQGHIYDALHRASLAATGYNFVTIDLVSSESFVDADGFTRHGVQTFNAIIERV